MSVAAIKFLTEEVASLRLRVKALEGNVVAKTDEKAEEKKKPGRPKKVAEDLPPPTAAPERLMTVPAEVKEKEKRKPSAWAIHCRDVMIPVIMRLKKEHEIKINHLTACGYLKEKNLENPTETEVLEALRYLKDHPEYKSTHQKNKALKSTDASSVSSGEGKKRGRPKKVKSSDASSVSSGEDKTKAKKEKDA
jgi:hypothetical protein